MHGTGLRSARPVASRAVPPRHRQRRGGRALPRCRTPPAGVGGLTPLPRDAVGRKPLQPQAQNASRSSKRCSTLFHSTTMLRGDHGGCARAARPSAADRGRELFIASSSQEGRCRADDPARRGGGRFVVPASRARAGRTCRRRGRERQRRGRHLIDAAWAHLADHHADGTAAQASSIAHSTSRPRRCDRGQRLGRCRPVETGSIGRTVLHEREIFGDPDTFLSACGRGPGMTGRPPHRERQRKAGDDDDLSLMRGNNSVQRAATQAAAENAVDGRDTQRQRSTAWDARPVAASAAKLPPSRSRRPASPAEEETPGRAGAAMAIPGGN